MARKVFISYDYDNDRHYKNLLVAWDANDLFAFSFYDQSVDVSVDSTAAAVIRRVISARINESSHFLCIVGSHTSKSAWVTWEVNKAVELKKRIIAVKTSGGSPTPLALLGVGASWARSFTFDGIKKAVESA